MKKTLLITLLILFINNILIAQEVSVFEVSGSYTWEVPEGVNSIKVYAWGGGGGGGAAIYENTRGGGGAGGSITVSTVSVQPGEVLQIIVGNRGVGGFSDGGNGGNTTISGSFGTILAYGGAGGKRGYRNSCQVVVGSYCCSSSSWGGCRSYCSIYNTVPCGGVQYGSAGIATVGLTFNGGSGGNGSAGISGAGGGSAGDMGSGGNANFGTAGIAGLGNYSGAKGADGRSTAGSGIPSSEVGGGGSGGFVGQQGFTSYAGGSGGPGKLVIEFIKDCTAPEFIKVPDSTNEETLPAAQCEKQIFYDIQVEEETNLFFEFSGATELTGSGSGSGELFKAGITNVFIKAINSCDEESTFNFEINLKDKTSPVITTNQDQNLTTEAGLCTASFEATATASDNCSVGAPTGVRSDDKPLTDPYPVGTTTITWTVSDANGNPAVPVVQTIKVTDNQAPVIITNQDQNLTTEAGLCTASFEATATATDNCSVGAPTGIRSDNKPLADSYPVGTTTITWTVNDANGNPAVPVVQTITVTDNQAPVITTNQNQNLTTEAGLCTASFEATASATDNCSVGAPTGIRSDNKPLTDSYPVGVTTITWTVSDINGNPATPVVQTITVTDSQAPSWETALGELDRTVFCGQDQLLSSAQNLQPFGFDNCTIKSIQKTSGNFVSTGLNGAGTFTNTWIAEDLAGNKSTVFNQVITIQGLEVDASASGTPVPLNSTATLSAKVIPAVEGISVNFYLDEEFKGSKATDEFGIATLDVTGLPLNVYKVTAVVGSGCAESIAYLPVYDPNGNFVTGGGWINSPEGALIGTTTVGKANFGFVSKYKKGSNQVDGNTEFQFNAGNLSFKSILHEAGTLVISGKKATYRGEGSINGVSGFKFTLVAIDGQWNGGTNPDQFRIKIWGSNGVIYDNGLGADENSEVSTVLGGGSIVIHESKTKGNKRVSAELITVPWNTPFETIRKKVDQMSSTWFESRKLLMTLDAGTYDPLTPGLYELKANLIDNEFFELDEPIAIQVLVQDKPKALDIKLSNQKVVKNAGSGTVIGSLNTIDPVDDIHTYSMDPNPDLEIRGNQLIWKGTNTPAAQMTITVFSTDRAGQTISKDIVLTREVGPNQFILYPNPAQNETNIMVDLDEGAEVEIQVFDAVGRMVIEDTIYRESTFIQTLDLNGMAPGMYMVQVKIGYIIMTERLIKR
ncbi:MAG: T9SS type A sorting domain-containing protein [Algoriphagus sp.]|uniref:glycine-rich domain-containing protein n=1 Tax=Algoriphagus sp. TaxID=1872435 RepID=UPI002734B3A9|nr:T9SS type A sorting domain-containing protein [Algoriphagus sp.]MDP3199749.1 T9SS type A sorting domain-containing protein [Algoriphagus sp.]